MGPKFFLLESGPTLKTLKPTGCSRNAGIAHILSEVKSLNKGHGVSALPAEMLAFGAGSLRGGRSAALRPPCWQEAQTPEQVLQAVLTAQVPGDSQHRPPGTHARCLQPAEVSCPSLRLSSDEALGVMTEATYVYCALADF